MKKKPRVKLDDLVPDVVLNEEDLEQIRGAVGFTNYAAYWGSIYLLKRTTRDAAQNLTISDGTADES